MLATFIAKLAWTSDVLIKDVKIGDVVVRWYNKKAAFPQPPDAWFLVTSSTRIPNSDYWEISGFRLHKKVENIYSGPPDAPFPESKFTTNWVIVRGGEILAGTFPVDSVGVSDKT